LLQLKLAEDVFGLISDYELFNAVKDKVLELVPFDQTLSYSMSYH
jgi:hypothetical protein